MVMATDALVPVTDHRPAALEMQRQPAAIKAETLEVASVVGPSLPPPEDMPSVDVPVESPLAEMTSSPQPAVMTKSKQHPASARVRMPASSAAGSPGSTAARERLKVQQDLWAAAVAAARPSALAMGA